MRSNDGCASLDQTDSMLALTGESVRVCGSAALGFRGHSSKIDNHVGVSIPIEVTNHHLQMTRPDESSSSVMAVSTLDRLR
jgi:hypothetical protein